MKKFLLSIFGGPVVHGHRTVSAWKLGLGFLIVVLIVGTAVFNKARLTTWLTPGNTVNVHFAQDYRLRPYFSQAKIAFVPVGMVTGDTELDDHTALVTVKLYGDNINKLGDNPSVTIRPTTMLGGNYMIDFQPGGDLSKPFTKGEIPVNQAHLPEELDKIIATFQPNALAGMKGTLTKFDDTLKGGTKEALQRFVHDAPDSLKPAGQVLDALRGLATAVQPPRSAGRDRRRPEQVQHDVRPAQRRLLHHARRVAQRAGQRAARLAPAQHHAGRPRRHRR
jgi:phospholipid/cholesterol/gamma-HCH transport system substrate-binding protein